MTDIKEKLLRSTIAMCVVLMIALGYEHHKAAELREKNARMEQQIKELTGQVEEISAQFIEVVRRVQSHGGR